MRATKRERLAGKIRDVLDYEASGISGEDALDALKDAWVDHHEGKAEEARKEADR